MAPPSADDREQVSIDLTDRERLLLTGGLNEWGGPARCTEALARAMGFRDVDDLLRGDGERLYEDLKHHRPMSRADWARALLATEIVFSSNVVGSGRDWSITTGLSDQETIALLRNLQRKVPRAWGPSGDR